MAMLKKPWMTFSTNFWRGRMKVLRTPDSRFERLPDFDFAANYVDIDGLRMHYVDGSYLYRHMIPPIADAGFRAIAPDLIGFGKSDKPGKRSDYSYLGHVTWMRQFLEALDLNEITLVCQDWGALIGLRLAAENERRFAMIVLANGGMPTGDQQMPKAFRIWRAFARFSPWFPIGRIVQSGTIRELPPEVVAAYDAPFPSSAYKAAARAFPMLVPTTPDDPASAANRAAWKTYAGWQKPFLTAFSNRDPITRGADQAFRESVPGAQDQPHTTIRNAGHFLQEDQGPELARIVIEFINID
jgi:haloalkane dehalogenase